MCTAGSPGGDGEGPEEETEQVVLVVIVGLFSIFVLCLLGFLLITYCQYKRQVRFKEILKQNLVQYDNSAWEEDLAALA